MKYQTICHKVFGMVLDYLEKGVGRQLMRCVACVTTKDQNMRGK